MNVIYTILILVALILSFLLGYKYKSHMPDEHSLVLKTPLYLDTEKPEQLNMLLPGTRLYYDHSMSEGFDVYHVYINVAEDLGKLEKTPHTDFNPLWALWKPIISIDPLWGTTNRENKGLICNEKNNWCQ